MTPVTGDPTVDALMTWLSEGGKLDAMGALLGLAALLRFVIVPLISALADRAGRPLTSTNKVLTIHAAGVVVAVLVGFFTHSGMTLTQAAFLGFAASNTAIGLHQTQQITSDASAAHDDQKQINATLDALDTNAALPAGAAAD